MVQIVEKWDNLSSFMPFSWDALTLSLYKVQLISSQMRGLGNRWNKSEGINFILKLMIFFKNYRFLILNTLKFLNRRYLIGYIRHFIRFSDTYLRILTCHSLKVWMHNDKRSTRRSAVNRNASDLFFYIWLYVTRIDLIPG